MIQIRGLSLLKINQITPTNIAVVLLTACRNHGAQPETCDLVKWGFNPALLACSHHSWMLLSTVNFMLMFFLWELRVYVSLESFCFTIENKQKRYPLNTTRPNCKETKARSQVDSFLSFVTLAKWRDLHQGWHIFAGSWPVSVTECHTQGSSWSKLLVSCGISEAGSVSPEGALS